MAWKILTNSVNTKYKARSCKCWDIYRQGRCADRLSNYAGYQINAGKAPKRMPLRYFVRIAADASSLGDTSSLKGYKTDFAYDFDNTCVSGVNPRKSFLTAFTSFLFCNFYIAREVESGSEKLSPKASSSIILFFVLCVLCS